MKSVALFLAIPSLLLAGDFWKEKKPADWSEKEAKKMTRDSPWAHDTTPRMEGMMAGGMPSGGRGGRGGRGGGGGMPSAEMGGSDMGGGGGGGEMGGGGMGGGGMQSLPTVHIRWDSATPVREAFSKLDVQNPFPKEIAAKVADYYVITVEGVRVPMGRPQGAAQQRQQRQQGDTQSLTREDLERLQQRMIQATTLIRKDKEPMRAEGVRLLQGERGPNFQFFFKKTDPIALEEKEVKLLMKVGPMTVETKFKPKDMVFDGALAL